MTRRPPAWLWLPVLLGALAGCGRSGVASVADLADHRTFNTPADLGRTFSVSGYVTAAPAGGGSLRLAAAPDTPWVNVLVLTTNAPAVTTGEQVRATGKLGQLHTSFDTEGAPYVQDHLYDWWETQAYLYNATVSPLG